MPNRLSDAISPYLRSHADNPVDWYPWGDEAFAEAARRDVPLLVSIGYSTCHWCHVMARESFSDPEVAGLLADSVVAVKVDREEHPEVDTTYLAAASAFTQNLGWPLNVLITPQGQAFYAFTYLPPEPLPGRPSFSQVIGALTEVWNGKRDDVEVNAARVTTALRASAPSGAGELPGPTELATLAEAAIEQADPRFGGLGVAPKFPNAPLLTHLLGSGVPTAVEFAGRTLAAMADSELRDPVEGGFFRYAVRQDWTEPHYERMLYDNAGLLEAYTALWGADHEANAWALQVAEGIADYLTRVLQLPHGGFASAQDSESELDGVRSEGGYYRLDAAGRAAVTAPALDGKVLTGWNGLAIGALASAGTLARRPEWIAAARRAADYLLRTHIDGSGTLHRVSVDGVVSTAVATLEDYGMFAAGLVELALAGGEPRYAELASALVDSCQGEQVDSAPAPPGGADPLLTRFGLALPVDASEGAYPSGPSAYARAALGLHRLGATPSVPDRDYRAIAVQALSPLVSVVRQNPAAYGAALEAFAGLACSSTELVVVLGDGIESGAAAELVEAALLLPADVRAVVDESEAALFASSGFTLFEYRTAGDTGALAYLCTDGVCRLPVSDPSRLAEVARAR